MYRIYLYYFVLYFTGFQCQFEDRELDYIEIKSLPSVIHNQNVYLPVLYQCSSLTKRRIVLSIDIEDIFSRKNSTIFRRHWYCRITSDIQILNVRVQLHRSIAYAEDKELNLYSWPIETGQLRIVMFDGEEQNENQIIKQIQYPVRFLSVHERPKIRSIRWNPLMYKIEDDFCLVEPGEN